MADIIDFNRYRKQRERKAATAGAAKTRSELGRTSQEPLRDKAEEDRKRTELDNKRSE